MQSCHAFVAHLMATYEPYIVHYFTKEVFLKCYLGIIHPLLDKSKWPHIKTNEIMPPNVFRPHVKPKISNKRERSEKPSYRRKFSVSYTYILQRHRAQYNNLTNASKDTRIIMVKLIVQCSSIYVFFPITNICFNIL